MLNLQVNPINEVAILKPVKPTPGIISQDELLSIDPKPLPGMIVPA